LVRVRIPAKELYGATNFRDAGQTGLLGERNRKITIWRVKS